MKLYSLISSERGKTIPKSGNDYIFFELYVGHDQIAQIELRYMSDSKKHYGITCDEWILQYRRVGGIEKEWNILDQDNVLPKTTANRNV